MKLVLAAILGFSFIQGASAGCYLGNTIEEFNTEIAKGSIRIQYIIDPTLDELNDTEAQLALSTVAAVETSLSGKDQTKELTPAQALDTFVQNGGLVEYLIAPGIFKQTIMVTYLIDKKTYGYIFTIDTGFRPNVETKAIIQQDKLNCLY